MKRAYNPVTQLTGSPNDHSRHFLRRERWNSLAGSTFTISDLDRFTPEEVTALIAHGYSGSNIDQCALSLWLKNRLVIQIAKQGPRSPA
jgi:hypothetical protein